MPAVVTKENELIKDLMTRETWELARMAICESPYFETERRDIEREFEISLVSLDDVLSLPGASFERLKERLIRAATTVLKDYHEELYQRICVQLDYCQLKKHAGWRAAEYLVGVLDVFVAQGGAALGVMFVKAELLDRLCGCKS